MSRRVEVRSVARRALANGAARLAGIAWFSAAVWVALHNAAHLTDRDLGGGYVVGCGRVFASQVPQLLLATAGAAVLLVGAGSNRAGTRATLATAAVLLVAWALAAALLLGAYAWDCPTD